MPILPRNNNNSNVIPTRVKSASPKYNINNMNYNNIELNKAQNTTRLINEIC